MQKHTKLILIFAVYTVVMAVYHIKFLDGNFSDILPILLVMIVVLVALWLLGRKRNQYLDTRDPEEQQRILDGDEGDDDDPEDGVRL